MRYKLIIGCGGSGLATMTEFCKRLAYSKNCETSEYGYLAIDSDENALDNFSRSIEYTWKGRCRPFVQTVALGRGCEYVDQIVTPYFIAPFKSGDNDVGRERLKEHWWHDEAGQPYRGNPGIRGAVANAVDSYGFTWFVLRNLSDAIGQAIDWFRMSGINDGNPDDFLDVYVISSLAGDTGRGCWNLVALKVREYLLSRYRLCVRIIGVLYDAMVYRDIFADGRNLELRCKVNTLTGLSELSVWLNNERRKMPISYRLPDLRNPQRENCDAIVAGGIEEMPCEGPITELRLIGKSECGYKPHQQYIKETADTLFLEMSSKALASKRINYFASVGSSGSATFEVEAAKIEGFCTAAAYDIVLNRMLDGGEDVAPDVAQFFDTIPINKKINGIADVRPGGSGNIFQRLARALMKRNRARFEHFLQNLPSMNTNEVQKKMESVVGRMPAVDVELALKDVLSALRIEEGPAGINAVIEASALCVLHGSPEQNLSLGRLRNFLMRINADISMLLELPAKIDPPMVVEDVIRDFGKRTIREMLLCKPRFNENEIATLLRNEGEVFSGVVADQFLVENYGEMRRVVVDLSQRVQKMIQRTVSCVEKMEQCCLKIRGTFAKDVYKSFDIPIGEDAFKELFVLPDRSLEAIMGDERNVTSILKPIVESRESLSRLIDGAVSIYPGFEDSCERILRQMSYEKDKVFDHELSQLIIQHVQLGKDFMRENFSFMKVLARNRKYWNDELDRHRGDSSWQDMASDVFRRALGVEPIVDWDGARKLPPVEVIKKSIIATFAHRTNLNGEIEKSCVKHATMTVWVPFEMTDGDWWLCEHQAEMSTRLACTVELLDIADQASSIYAYYSHIVVSVVHPECTDERPDVSAPPKKSKNIPDVQSTEKRTAERPWHLFDAYRSLRYYMERDVNEKLKEAEREDGKAIFDKGRGVGGLGYPSPIYVRDKKWSALRWKPWCD